MNYGTLLSVSTAEAHLKQLIPVMLVKFTTRVYCNFLLRRCMQYSTTKLNLFNAPLRPTMQLSSCRRLKNSFYFLKLSKLKIQFESQIIAKRFLNLRPHNLEWLHTKQFFFRCCCCSCYRRNWKSATAHIKIGTSLCCVAHSRKNGVLIESTGT